MHLTPFTKPLTSKSRNANVEAPCPDHILSFGESGNLHLCVAHAILHLTKILLRNSSTPTLDQALPTFGKFISSLSGKPPMPG
jgi:hypothetical protein